MIDHSRLHCFTVPRNAFPKNQEKLGNVLPSTIKQIKYLLCLFEQTDFRDRSSVDTMLGSESNSSNLSVASRCDVSDSCKRPVVACSPVVTDQNNVVYPEVALDFQPFLSMLNYRHILFDPTLPRAVSNVLRVTPSSCVVVDLRENPRRCC